MAASVQCRQQERNFGTVMEIRKDDDLALFHELENRAMEKNELLLHGNNDFCDQLAPKQDRSSIFKTAITVPARRTGVDAFLNSENDKTDYDWLLTPPDTPLFPSLEMEQNNSVLNQIAISNGNTVDPEIKKPQTQPISRNYETFKPIISSTLPNRRPSSSGGPTPPTSRPATPTSRPTLPAIKKPNRPITPTLRPTLPSSTKPNRPITPTSRPTISTTTKPNRPITPSSRASLPATTKPNRPNTPTSRASLPSTTKPNRSNSPSSRASLPSTTKPNRPITPTSRPNRPITPSSRPTSRSSTPTRSSSVTKSGSKMAKNPGPSRGISPTVKSRPLKPSETPVFLKEIPIVSRKKLPDRPNSAPRPRAASNGKMRQNGSDNNSGFSVLATSRGCYMNGEDVNPVLMGTKMVERVVNMRKLVPPKQDDNISSNSLGKNISSQGNLGRTLSKTSLDMAIRHMDITKRIPGNLRPLVTNIPASSVYSVRSGPTKSKTLSSSDSPLATSSNASSDPSVNNGSNFLDAIEIENNDFRNEREKSSPAMERD